MVACLVFWDGIQFYSHSHLSKSEDGICEWKWTCIALFQSADCSLKKTVILTRFILFVWLLIRCDLGFSILLTDTWHATEGTRDLNQQPSLALYLLSSSQPNVVEENLYQWEPIEFESSLRLLGRAAIVDPRSVKVLFLCLEEETKEGRDFGHLILWVPGCPGSRLWCGWKLIK